MAEIALGKTFTIQKAWAEGTDTHIEGWLSTPKKDKERDIMEPEAFLPVMDVYFSNFAPISYSHGTDTLPAGHLQKAAAVRDGQILKTVDHPTDPTEFKHFDGTGSGMYVHGVINVPEPAAAVQKGNVGCFSFIAHGHGEKLSDGGTRYTELTDWMESTISPYPINTAAVFRIAKAHGYQPEKELPDMTKEEMEQLAALIAKAVTPVAPPAETPPIVKALTADDLTAALATFKTELTTQVEAQITKANTERGIGTGTKASGTPPVNTPDAVDTAIKKATTAIETYEDVLRESINRSTSRLGEFDPFQFTPDEQAIINHVLWNQLNAGMRDEGTPLAVF